MQYKTILKKKWKKFDPFVHEHAEHMLEVTKYFYVLPARAPWTQDHILIVPRKKIVLLNELTKRELDYGIELISKWDKLLHKHHTDVTLVLKDGYMGGKSEKSIQHLHFHLVPDCAVTAKTNGDDNREFYADDEYTKIVNALKKKFVS